VDPPGPPGRFFAVAPRCGRDRHARGGV